MFVLSVINFVFLITSLSTTSHFLKSTGIVFNLSTSKSSTFAFKLFNVVGTLPNLAMCQFSKQ